MVGRREGHSQEAGHQQYADDHQLGAGSGRKVPGFVALRHALLICEHCLTSGCESLRVAPAFDPTAPWRILFFTNLCAKRSYASHWRRFMTTRLGVFAALLGVAITAGVHAQHLADPRVADLIGAGRIRFGSFPPQHIKDPATGELKGPTVHVMRALGAGMGLSVVLVELPTFDKLIECLDVGACDVGCLGYDPGRAEQVGGFTPPFMQVEFTLLVPGGSSINTV